MAYLNIRKDSKNCLKFIRKRSPKDTLPRCIYQGMGYLVLVHFRVLYGVFYAEPKYDDCAVEHFRMIPEFAAKFTPDMHVPPVGHDEIRIHLNKLLVHFTAERWRNNRPPMNEYEKFFPDIVRLIARFEEALPSPYHGVFKRRMAELAQGD